MFESLALWSHYLPAIVTDPKTVPIPGYANVDKVMNAIHIDRFGGS